MFLYNSRKHSFRDYNIHHSTFYVPQFELLIEILVKLCENYSATPKLQIQRPWSRFMDSKLYIYIKTRRLNVDMNLAFL